MGRRPRTVLSSGWAEGCRQPVRRSGPARAGGYVLHHDLACQLLPPELGSAPGRPVGGAWSGGSRPESSTNCRLDWSRACVDGFHIRAKRGLRRRSVAGRPEEDGQQTPPDLRRTRHPAQSHYDRGERQRRHPVRLSRLQPHLLATPQEARFMIVLRALTSSCMVGYVTPGLDP